LPSHLLVMGASAVTFSSLALCFFVLVYVSSPVFGVSLSVGIEIVVESDLESSNSSIPKYDECEWLVYAIVVHELEGA
jgi:hypothetical protein